MGSSGQSKKQSFFEALSNVVLGYWIAIATQLVVFPQYGIHIEFQTDLLIGFWFLVVSLVRSYVLRRLFNMVRR